MEWRFGEKLPRGIEFGSLGQKRPSDSQSHVAGVVGQALRHSQMVPFSHGQHECDCGELSLTHVDTRIVLREWNSYVQYPYSSASLRPLFTP